MTHANERGAHETNHRSRDGYLLCFQHAEHRRLREERGADSDSADRPGPDCASSYGSRDAGRDAYSRSDSAAGETRAAWHGETEGAGTQTEAEEASALGFVG